MKRMPISFIVIYRRICNRVDCFAYRSRRRKGKDCNGLLKIGN